MKFELQRLPTYEEIIERIGISAERYHEVMRVSKPILSLHAKHAVTNEAFINGITDVDGDSRRQPALLRLALDDVVNYLLNLFSLWSNCVFPPKFVYDSSGKNNFSYKYML